MKQLIRNCFNNFKNMHKGLFMISLIIIIYGLFNIVNASSREAISLDVPLFYYFYKHLEMILIGVFLGLFIINVDTKKYKPFAIFCYIVVGIFLFYLAFFGKSNRGAKNWIKLGPIVFQPSEFIKPIIIVCLALFFEKYKNFFRNKKIDPVQHYNKIGISLFICLGCAVLIFAQKDLGTMMILMIIYGVIFLASPVFRTEKLKTIVVLFSTLIVVILAGLVSGKNLLSEAQMDRFNYFNPCSKYEDSGYQICNGFIAINDGGLTGLGIGKSRQKYSYIPEPHTDSVFSIIIEEGGLITGLAIFIIYGILLYFILDISSKSTSLRGKYISLGVATYLFTHIFINLGGLFGLIPLTGVPLPFLSYGGSFTISAICALCLVQRVHIETKKDRI